VEVLADVARMGVSTLHHQFRALIIDVLSQLLPFIGYWHQGAGFSEGHRKHLGALP